MITRLFCLLGGALAVVVALPTSSTTRSLSQTEIQERMRLEVAYQANVELSLYGSGWRPLRPDGIKLTRVPAPSDDLEIWRGDLPSDHSHPYLLAVVGDEVVRLGGFSAPELGNVTPILSKGRVSQATVRELAEAVARLADRNGGVQCIVASRADLAGYVSIIGETWRRRTPRAWPGDTTITLPHGDWHATITLLCRDTRSFALAWTPTVYGFEFSGGGRLLGWSAKSAEDFVVQGIPLPDTPGK